MESRAETGTTRWRAPTNDRWTESDGRSVAQAMQDSGLNRSAFARRYGLSVHRVKYWILRCPLVPNAESISSPPAFIPVTLEATDDSSRRPSGLPVKLSFRELWQIEIPCNVREDELKKVLRCLREVTS